jgi:hypothetical protein
MLVGQHLLGGEHGALGAVAGLAGEEALQALGRQRAGAQMRAMYMGNQQPSLADLQQGLIPWITGGVSGAAPTMTR